MGGACEVICFCEAPADFRTASDLIDRVLRERGPSWVADVVDANAEGVRRWVDDGSGHPFFDVHDYKKYAHVLDVRGQLPLR